MQHRPQSALSATALAAHAKIMSMADGVLGADYYAVRTVGSPLTAHMLRPLDPRCRVVQFNTALTDGDYKVLGEWLAQYPNVALRAYASRDGSIRDVDFLRFFPRLLKFSADYLYDSLESIEGLGYLRADATEIGLGQTKRRLSLQPLARFANLRRLYLERHTKDIAAISQLPRLVSLTLRSVTLPDLSILQPIRSLRALDIKLGGIRDLRHLPLIGQIDYLELWLIRGLADVSPVARMPHLRRIHLQALKHVTQLPDLSQLANLDTVWLETMKGLTDLSPLLTAPSLRRVAIVDMSHLQPDDVAPLAAHPRLEYLLVGLGSKRKNDAVARLVPLPAGDDWSKAASLRGEE